MSFLFLTTIPLPVFSAPNSIGRILYVNGITPRIGLKYATKPEFQNKSSITLVIPSTT